MFCYRQGDLLIASPEEQHQAAGRTGATSQSTAAQGRQAAGIFFDVNGHKTAESQSTQQFFPALPTFLGRAQQGHGGQNAVAAAAGEAHGWGRGSTHPGFDGAAGQVGHLIQDTLPISCQHPGQRQLVFLLSRL